MSKELKPFRVRFYVGNPDSYTCGSQDFRMWGTTGVEVARALVQWLNKGGQEAFCSTVYVIPVVEASKAGGIDRFGDGLNYAGARRYLVIGKNLVSGARRFPIQTAPVTALEAI